MSNNTVFVSGRTVCNINHLLNNAELYGNHGNCVNTVRPLSVLPSALTSHGTWCQRLTTPAKHFSV